MSTALKNTIQEPQYAEKMANFHEDFCLQMPDFGHLNLLYRRGDQQARLPSATFSPKLRISIRVAFV
jgi:hypothetical protein